MFWDRAVSPPAENDPIPSLPTVTCNTSGHWSLAHLGIHGKYLRDFDIASASRDPVKVSGEYRYWGDLVKGRDYDF